MRCDIKRGAHPEQRLLCTADEFTGMILFVDTTDLVIENCREEIAASQLVWNLSVAEVHCHSRD